MPNPSSAFNDTPCRSTNTSLHVHVLSKLRLLTLDTPIAACHELLEACVTNVPPRAALPPITGAVTALLHWLVTLCSGYVV